MDALYSSETNRRRSSQNAPSRFVLRIVAGERTVQIRKGRVPNESVVPQTIQLLLIFCHVAISVIEYINSTHKRPLCGHCAPVLAVNPANRAAPAACALGDLHSKKAFFHHYTTKCHDGKPAAVRSHVSASCPDIKNDSATPTAKAAAVEPFISQETKTLSISVLLSLMDYSLSSATQASFARLT